MCLALSIRDRSDVFVLTWMNTQHQFCAADRILAFGLKIVVSYLGIIKPQIWINSFKINVNADTCKNYRRNKAEVQTSKISNEMYNL